MTKQDAIFFLNELRSANNCDETIDMAIAALNEVGSHATQLGENGLMPCGCGGKAEIVRAIEYWDWAKQSCVELKKVWCDKCYMSTPGSVTNEYAVQKWNTAMSGGACSHEK